MPQAHLQVLADVIETSRDECRGTFLFCYGIIHELLKINLTFLNPSLTMETICLKRLKMQNCYQRLVGNSVALWALMLVLANAAHAVDYTWSGSRSDNWSDVRNWVPQGIPGAEDTVTVDGTGSPYRNPDLNNRDTTIARLNFSAGSITYGTLRVINSIVWTGGMVSCDLVSNGDLNINGSADKTIDYDDSVINNGQATWSAPADGTGRVVMEGRARFVNSSTFQAISDGTIFLLDERYSDGYFDNNGTFAKIGGSGVTSVLGSATLSFNQSGVIRADTGSIAFAGRLNLMGSNSIGGVGQINLSGGIVSLNALTTLNGVVELSGSTLNGDTLGSLANVGGGFLR